MLIPLLVHVSMGQSLYRYAAWPAAKAHRYRGLGLRPWSKPLPTRGIVTPGLEIGFVQAQRIPIIGDRF